jgi:hypothetical protein
MSSEDAPNDERPTWDQQEADDFVGQYVLVGITYLKADRKTLKAQGQYHGRIVSADKTMGFEIRCEGFWVGKTMTLPPDTRSFRPASPGEYKLRSTGEIVKDPDLLANWTSTEALKS